MTGSPPAETRVRAERDGCDCPKWVVRCAHLADGRRLWFFDSAAITGWWSERTDGECPLICPDCGAAIHISEGRFGFFGPGVFEEPTCLCRVPLTMSLPSRSVFLARDQALTAFYDLYERLIAGDAP